MLENTEKNTKQPKTGAAALSFALDFTEQLLLCFCIVVLAFSFLFRICVVSGDSMLPTLKDGQRLLVSDLLYEPEAGDIVIFHQTSETNPFYNEPILKRVVATAGQTVCINFTRGTVTVDGVLLDEPYIQLTDRWTGMDIQRYTLYADHHMSYHPNENGTTEAIFEIAVPDGNLFVMGDNRNNSTDSRSIEIGQVDRRELLGKALFLALPGVESGTGKRDFNRIGVLH